MPKPTNSLRLDIEKIARFMRGVRALTTDKQFAVFLKENDIVIRHQIHIILLLNQRLQETRTKELLRDTAIIIVWHRQHGGDGDWNRFFTRPTPKNPTPSASPQRHLERV